MIRVANSTSIPEEGYLSTVNVSVREVKNTITLTLDLTETSPLGEPILVTISLSIPNYM